MKSFKSAIKELDNKTPKYSFKNFYYDENAFKEGMEIESASSEEGCIEFMNRYGMVHHFACKVDIRAEKTVYKTTLVAKISRFESGKMLQFKYKSDPEMAIEIFDAWLNAVTDKLKPKILSSASSLYTATTNLEFLPKQFN